MKNKGLVVVGVLGGILLTFLVGYAVLNTEKPLGSVNVASEYHSTSTRNLAAGVTKITSSTSILGSVVITSSSASEYWILNWDGVGTVADSSTIVAYFTSLPTVGTYTFDLVLSKGLYISSTPANSGNYVVTYRNP